MSLQDILLWLFNPSPGQPGAVYLVLVAVYLLLILGCAAVYILRRSLFPGNALHIRIARRFGTFGMIVGAVGLVLLAARYLGIYWLQMRVLLVLASLAVVALAAYFGWYLQRDYPTERAAYERARQRDLFVRPSAHSARRRARKSRR